MANALLLPVARYGARDIEPRLADGGAAHQTLLNETFRRPRRRTRGPLVLVSERTLLMNAVAAGRFTAADRPLLWDIALHAVASDPTRPVTFTAREGTSMLGAVNPVYDQGIRIAALVTFDGPDDRPSPADRPSFGWESLTDSEPALVRLVSVGLTNREAAARLYLSHHTVDSHLRHIFRKLGINSRVQLARIAASMRTDPTTESA